MTTKRWNAEAVLTVPVYAPNLSDGTTWTTDANDLPAEIAAELTRLVPLADCNANGQYEIEIEFESNGYAEPAHTYGPPENCSPAEGEDERTVTGATLYNHGAHIGALSSATFGLIYSTWETEITEVEVDTDGSDSGGERDDYDDRNDDERGYNFYDGDDD